MGIEDICLGVVTKKQLFNKDFDDNFLILSNIQDPTANDIPSLLWGILATSEY